MVVANVIGLAMRASGVAERSAKRPKDDTSGHRSSAVEVVDVGDVAMQARGPARDDTP
jgi:hypothetical protein